MLDKVRYPVALTPLCNVAVAPRSSFIVVAPQLHCSTAVASLSFASLLSLPASLLRTAQKRDGGLKAGFTLLLKLGPICQHSLIHIHTIIVSHTKASSW